MMAQTTALMAKCINCKKEKSKSEFSKNQFSRFTDAGLAQFGGGACKPCIEVKQRKYETAKLVQRYYDYGTDESDDCDDDSDDTDDDSDDTDEDDSDEYDNSFHQTFYRGETEANYLPQIENLKNQGKQLRITIADAFLEMKLLPDFIALVGDKIGHLLIGFSIGEEESGFPAHYLKPKQWSDFFSKCPNLRVIQLRSNYSIDKHVVDTINATCGDNLIALTITGNDKITGEIKSDFIAKLCLDKTKCGHCFSTGDGKSKLKTCARCNCIRYCQASCQKKDWKVHKLVCDDFSKSNSQTDTNQEQALYLPKLKYLCLTDQDLSDHDFKRVRKCRQGIRLITGRSGGYSMAAQMLGFDEDCFRDSRYTFNSSDDDDEYDEYDDYVNGFSPSDVDDLMCQGISPFDSDASMVMAALYGDY